MRTDCHIHVFNAGVGIAGARYIPNYTAQISDWVAAAAPHAIERAVVVQPSFLGTDNQWLLDHLHSGGDQYRGVVVLAPTTEIAQLQVLDAIGVRGVRINTAGKTSIEQDCNYPSVFWTEIIRLGWHVQLHHDTANAPTLIDKIPIAVPLVMDHFAKPSGLSARDATVLAVTKRAARHKVYVKLSASYRLDRVEAKPLAQLWCDALGKDRLLWGSDWPHTGYETSATYARCVEPLFDWFDETVTQAILVDNCQGLYWD